MPLEQHNAQLRAVIEQNRRTLERMQQLLATLESSISTNAEVAASAKVILIVDDNPNDARMLESSMQRLKLQNRLETVSDGAGAINYIKGEGVYHDRVLYPPPLLLFLDLKMPSLDGFHVLDWLKRHPQYATFPVVVMGTDRESKQMSRAYDLGAKCYLTKPVTPEDVKATLNALHILVAA
jgi:CheY-like chemotaxis protein